MTKIWVFPYLVRWLWIVYLQREHFLISVFSRMLILPFTDRQVCGKDNAMRHKLIKRWRCNVWFSALFFGRALYFIDGADGKINLTMIESAKWFSIWGLTVFCNRERKQETPISMESQGYVALRRSEIYTFVISWQSLVFTCEEETFINVGPM